MNETSTPLFTGPDPDSIEHLFSVMTGHPALFPGALHAIGFPAGGMGYSQLNELLLLLGYDRVTHSFFQFLVDGTLEYEIGSQIHSIEQLKQGIERVRKISLLFFGNVKFGFKRLSRDSQELEFYRDSIEPIEEIVFSRRHEPIHALDPIAPSDTYYLGYIVKRELDERLTIAPDDRALLDQRKKLDEIRSKGVANQRTYLTADHIDVYVATSMRRRHEFIEVAEFTQRVFSDPNLAALKLRWFDPTQAFCEDRVDKGLAEALMLKRAKCTLYLAQESDTLGKDSELASTLAQGKPVIAYVPAPEESEIAETIGRLARLYERPKMKVILERLQALAPDLAWSDAEVRGWIDSPETADEQRALQRLTQLTRDQYEKRATTLKRDHPLGVQVNLDTGVANGVLVVRSASDCASLIRRIVTRTLEFRVEEMVVNGITRCLLREAISDSIFRVMTSDAMLANSFWNFYLEPE